MQDYVHVINYPENFIIQIPQSVGNLDNGRAGSDSVIRYRSVAASQDDIALTVNWSRARGSLGDGYGEAAHNRGCLGKDRSSDGDEGRIDLRLAISSLEGVAGGQEGDGGTSGDLLRVGGC